MNTAKLDKAYPLLTSQERFRLAVLALARNDDAELDRLDWTAPKGTAMLLDPAYVHRLRMLMHGVAGVMMEIQFILGKLHVLKAITGLSNRETITNAQVVPPWLIRASERSTAELVGELRAVWDALGDFAGDRLELDPQTIIEAFLPSVAECVQTLLQTPSSLPSSPANESLRQETRQRLHAFWTRCFGESRAS
jgi:hypothetical protein